MEARTEVQLLIITLIQSGSAIGGMVEINEDLDISVSADAPITALAQEPCRLDFPFLE